MEKTSREYAEKLAKEYTQHDVENFDSQSLYVGKSKEEIYTDGYMKAVEETNAKGLLEACEIALRYFNNGCTGALEEAAFHALNNVIKNKNK